MAMHEKTRFIKVHLECVLPVPYEVRDALDAVAESGLDALRQLVEGNVTTLVPGTVATSWQSMPQSWRPKRSNVVLQEQISPELAHAIISDEEGERVTFVDMSEPPVNLHPWDQGLFIFPENHPLHRMEQEYYAAYVRGGRDSDISEEFEDTREVIEAKEVLELEAGDGN